MAEEVGSIDSALPSGARRAPARPALAIEQGEPPLVLVDKRATPCARIVAVSSTRKPKPARLTPKTRVGTWRIDSELGHGGMAAVYAVTNTRFGKRAALKLAHREMLAHLPRDSFVREARVVHLIGHPDIPDVFACGSYDTRPYLVMELLEGDTLGQRFDAGLVTRAQALAIVRALATIVAHAHAAGVVHRDLKLDNVFLEETPTGDRVRLLDWGVARILTEPDPLHGMVAGTLAYVAPEQISGTDVTPASDVYSLGVLAYQLLVGAPPFTACVDLDLIRKHLYEPPPPPTLRVPDLPADLAALLLAMLRKDPATRPSLAAVTRALDAHLVGGRRRWWTRAIAAAAALITGAVAAVIA